MMQQEGYVVNVMDENKALVEISGGFSLCEHCANTTQCSSGLLNQISQPRRYLVSHNVDLQVGDRVNLVVSEGAVFRAALASYGIPLIFIIGGVITGQWLAGDDAAVIGMVVGSALGFLMLWYFERRLHNESKLTQSPFSLQKLNYNIVFLKNLKE